MARKRQEGVTTYPRYKGKVFKVAMGLFGDPEMARAYAESLTIARASGIGIYRAAFQEIKTVLSEKVPSAQWGLYKAFINEVVNKVIRKKVAEVDDVVDKWTKFGLDSEVLRACAEKVLVTIPPETPKPAEKTA